MADDWPWEECRDLDLGDARRNAVVRKLLTAAEKSPAGTVTGIVKTSAERQAAYKFLESEHTSYVPLARAFAVATARRASTYEHVFVAVDGSSLSLADHAGTKFGAVGATEGGGRGMKVITAYAVAPDGVPLGILNQQWWARVPRRKGDRAKCRKFSERETRHWCDALEASKQVLAATAPQTTPWFVIDREGDGFHVLARLRQDCHFTIRANANRRVLTEHGARKYLSDVLAKQPLHAIQWLDVPATAKRSARRARLHVRIARVTLDMREKWTKQRLCIPVNVVELREVHTTPRGESPIVWRLYTDHPVETAEDLERVVNSYRTRWRIEEFHRTWKTGACNVERSQLRSQKPLLIWATLMATVAARIERLKVLSRTQPDLPPETELSAHELRALLLLHREYRKRNEVVPERIPSIALAVLWIAELGGYTGKSSGGPPGTITIRRGLETLRVAAKMVKILDAKGK
jgi:hypothetical protein